MPRGRKNLQEMESGTKQSRTAVNAGAKPAEPMQKLSSGIPDGQTGGWEDLGGPTPENSRPDDDSNKLKDPAATLQRVRNIVNQKASAGDASASSVKEEEEYDDEDEVLEEDPEYDEDEYIEEEDPSDEDYEDEEYEDEDDELEEEIQEIESQIEDDVEALLSGEDLSEEFKFKAKTVFEAALNSRTEQIEEAILRKYEEKLVEEISAISEELEERIDSYLEYVAEEWVEQNELAIERGIKVEMTESFLENLKGLFEDYYVSIPEERYDVIESMVDKLDEMEGKLNEQIERNIALNNRLAESVSDVLVSEISEGLALSQKEKLASLAKNVEFDSEDDYRDKLVALRESYFPSTSTSVRSTQDYLVEDVTVDATHTVVPNGSMEVYLNALERVSRK
jgi:hypothetical protein